MVGVCAVIAAFIWRIKQTSLDDALPEASAQARVAKIGSSYRGVIFGNGSFISLGRVYYVTFELLPEHTLKNFAIPVVGLLEVDEGATGVLTFQGRRFVDFKAASDKPSKGAAGNCIIAN